MDLETVEQIVSLLSEHQVSEIIVESEGLRVVARRPRVSGLSAPVPPVPELEGPVPAYPNSAEEVAQERTLNSLMLTAGMVGLFRHAEPPLGYGAQVTPGQIVGSIEAMKVLNDAHAEAGGQVVDVFVEEGAPVEYGQALFRLMPDASTLAG